MTHLIDLLDDVMAQTMEKRIASDRPVGSAEAPGCNGCGEAKPDVDLFAENTETGEELWLCLACGDW